MQRRILLAEDDPDDRSFFYEFLQGKNNISISYMAVDGVELIEYLAKNKSLPDLQPDIIILDQNMPRKNGMQTLEYLKNDAEYSQIPIVIYSTYANDFLVKKSMELGAARVVSKPQDREGYYEMMDEIFKALAPVPH